MNKIDIKPRLHIYTRILNQARLLQQQNLELFVKALGLSFGVVAYKQSGGGLSDDLKVSYTSNTLELHSGYIIALISGEITPMYIPAQSVPLAGLTPNSTYYIYIAHKYSNYESGTLSFTNGSKVVSVSGGDFTKLDPFEYLVISDSSLGNNGEYKIAKVTSDTGLELVSPFTGTSESGLVWKIGGYFGDYNPADKLLYTYDDYDLLVVNQPTSRSVVALAQVNISAFNTVSSLIDLRPTNLFSQKGLFNISGDDVLGGAAKDITTIEEKAKASRVDLIANDVFTGGVIQGFGISVNGNKFSLTAGAAYDENGIRITSKATTFDMVELEGAGVVELDKHNYLHIFYVSPSNYGWYWSSTGISTNPSHVFLADVYYSSTGGIEIE